MASVADIDKEDIRYQKPAVKTTGTSPHTAPDLRYRDPLPKLDFKNRRDEIRELTDSYAPPYYLVEAPAGYGKTTLLKEIGRHLQENSWKCAYISVKEHPSLPFIIAELASELGISHETEQRAVVQEPEEARGAGQDLGEAIKRHLDSESDGNSPVACAGLVLLIDVDKDPWQKLLDTVAILLTGFIPGMEEVLRNCRLFQKEDVHTPFRVILAGRNLSHLVDRRACPLPLTTLPLTPFTYEPIRDATNAFLGQRSTEQIVAHLMHYTAGHPGCMARVLAKYKDVGGAPDVFFNEFADQILDGIVCKEAEDVRRNIPAKLRRCFNDLSVFRYLNDIVLDKWLHEVPLYKREFVDGFSLADQLYLNGLMAYEEKSYLLRDNMTRRLLAILLMREIDHGQFARRCLEAQKICQDYIQHPNPQSPHLWIIEALFQFLQQHAPQIQDAKRRAEIRKEFFEQIVPKTLALLLVSNCDLGMEARAFERVIEKDWEFEFTVNYFLREDQYNGLPYERLKSEVKAFFAMQRGLDRPVQKQDLARLRQILDTRFNEGELRTLSADLDVDYDDLPGEGKADKARELVAYFERRDRIPDIVELVRQRRPRISW